jgi:hypothetical protein
MLANKAIILLKTKDQLQKWNEFSIGLGNVPERATVLWDSSSFFADCCVTRRTPSSTVASQDVLSQGPHAIIGSIGAERGIASRLPKDVKERGPALAPWPDEYGRAAQVASWRTAADVRLLAVRPE